MLVSSYVCFEGGADHQQGAEHELTPLINSSTLSKLTISCLLELKGKVQVVYIVYKGAPL